MPPPSLCLFPGDGGTQARPCLWSVLWHQAESWLGCRESCFEELGRLAAPPLPALPSRAADRIMDLSPHTCLNKGLFLRLKVNGVLIKGTAAAAVPVISQ